MLLENGNLVSITNKKGNAVLGIFSTDTCQKFLRIIHPPHMKGEIIYLNGGDQPTVLIAPEFKENDFSEKALDSLLRIVRQVHMLREALILADKTIKAMV